MAKKGNSKKAIAYEKIRALINDPNFNHGNNLTETTLAEKLNLSRTPIREALSALQSEGFLRVIPNRGIFVQEPSISDVRNLYDLRIALEEFVLRELCGTLDESDFLVLDEILNAQEACIAETKTAGFLLHDRRFHQFFFKKYANPILIDFFDNLRDRLYRVNYRMLQSRENMKSFHGEHRRIVDYIKVMDKESAVIEMEAHLKGAKRRLL